MDCIDALVLLVLVSWLSIKRFACYPLLQSGLCIKPSIGHFNSVEVLCVICVVGLKYFQIFTP